MHAASTKAMPSYGTIDYKRQKFQATMFPHLDAAYNLAKWLTHDDHDAARVVEDAYQQAFRDFDHCVGDEFKTWLLSIVRNKTQTRYRRRSFLRLVAFGRNHFEQIRNRGRNPLRGFIQELPIDNREVFVMRELERMSYRQIAVVCGLPIETVLSRLAIARNCLASHYPLCPQLSDLFGSLRIKRTTLTQSAG